MLLSLFALGAVGFWILLAVSWVVITYLVETEKGLGTTLMMLATAAFVLLVGKTDVLGFVGNHWVWFVAAIPIYLAAGTGWGIAKWKWLTIKARMKYDELRAEFEARTEINDGLDELEKKSRWAEIIEGARICGTTSYCHCGAKPMARKHKALVMMWMCCWPWSAVWTLLKDPIREAFLYIYYRTAALLQRMSDKAFAGTTIHMMTEEEKKQYNDRRQRRAREH